MRLIINLLLAFLLSITLTGLIATLTLKSSHLSAASFKTALLEANVYEELHRFLLDNLDQISQTGEADDFTRLLKTIFQRELSPAYFQAKSEKLIDDLVIWFDTPNSPPPVISLTDLKEKLIQGNPKLVKDLLALEKEYQTNKPAIQASINQEAKEAGEPEPPPLPNLSLSQYLESEPIIPIGSYLKPLTWGAWLSRHWYLYLLALGLIFVFLYLINAHNRPLKILGVCLLFAVILNAMPLILTFLYSHTLSTIISTHLPPLVFPIINTLLIPLLAAYQKTAFLVLGISLVCSLILIFVPNPKRLPVKGK